MSLWLKKRFKSLREKKGNCKLNPYSGQGLEGLAKLISELKAKRESLAAQAGFTTAVSGFVANSQLGWSGSNDSASPKVSTKKKLWHTLKKSSRKPQRDKVHAPSPNPQSPGEYPQQHCSDQNINKVNIDVVDAKVAPEKRIDVSATPENVGVRVVPETATPSRLYPLYRRLFTLIVVVIVLISVVSEAKKVAVGTAAIVFFLLHVVLKRRPETFPMARCFTLNSVLYSPIAILLPIICYVIPCKKFSNSSQGDSLPNGNPDFSEPRKQPPLRPDIVPISTSTTERLAKTGRKGLAVLPLSADNIWTNPVFPEENIQGSKLSRSKLLRKFVVQRCASDPPSSHVRNGTILGFKVMSSSAGPAPDPSDLSSIKGTKLSCSDSNLQGESPRTKGQVLKIQHTKSCPGRINLEEHDDHKIGSVEKKFGYALTSTLLIVVLCGLMTGRLHALALALSWCFFIKFVGIAWQNTARRHRNGTDVLEGRD